MQWLTFVGEGRSGHTIVSAILGCHPHIRMGEEQKYITKWRRDGWSREQIMEHLLLSGVGKARKLLGFEGILIHEEPLQIVGDKCGWDAVLEVKKRGAPVDILTQFGVHMRMPVKTLVTVRHPLDNISAWVESNKYKRIFPDDMLRYRRMIRRYKRFHDVAVNVVEGQDIYILHNERLIGEPGTVLRELETWLGLEPNSEWREYCASKLFAKPNQRRNNLEWPEEYIERVNDYIATCPLLEHYRG